MVQFFRSSNLIKKSILISLITALFSANQAFAILWCESYYVDLNDMAKTDAGIFGALVISGTDPTIQKQENGQKVLEPISQDETIRRANNLASLFQSGLTEHPGLGTISRFASHPNTSKYFTNVGGVTHVILHDKKGKPTGKTIAAVPETRVKCDS